MRLHNVLSFPRLLVTCLLHAVVVLALWQSYIDVLVPGSLFAYQKTSVRKPLIRKPVSENRVRKPPNPHAKSTERLWKEVAKFMLEISGEDSVQRPWTATSSWSTIANFQIPPPDILELNDGSTAAN